MSLLSIYLRMPGKGTAIMTVTTVHILLVHIQFWSVEKNLSFKHWLQDPNASRIRKLDTGKAPGSLELMKLSLPIPQGDLDLLISVLGERRIPRVTHPPRVGESRSLLKGDPLQLDAALEHSSDQGSEQGCGTSRELARQLAMAGVEQLQEEAPSAQEEGTNDSGAHIAARTRWAHRIGWKASHRLQ